MRKEVYPYRHPFWLRKAVPYVGIGILCGMTEWLFIVGLGWILGL